MNGSSLISPEAFGAEIASVLISRDRIAGRLNELADEIAASCPPRVLTILDTGRTLRELTARAAAEPASPRSRVLLRKRRDDLPDRPEPDWIGFDIKDHFVVGYGLDYDDLYRNLPDLCLLEGLTGRAAT